MRTSTHTLLNPARPSEYAKPGFKPPAVSCGLMQAVHAHFVSGSPYIAFLKGAPIDIEFSWGLLGLNTASTWSVQVSGVCKKVAAAAYSLLQKSVSSPAISRFCALISSLALARLSSLVGRVDGC